jgi:DNA-binding response OmpR family regulator
MLSRIARRLENTQLEVASNGREGRLMAIARTPSLIVLDSHLADCDARDLIVHLGRASLRATVPLAVVSADERARIKFISAGAVSFMTKPLKIAEVERSMVTLLDVFPAR